MPDLEVPFVDPCEEYLVYKRDPETLAREQAIPGQAGLEHRVGGLEKDESGGVSYDPENHEEMTHLRAAKVAAVAKNLPPLEVNGEPEGDVLVLGWGGTYGSICSAVRNLQAEGFSVSSLHLRHLNPFPNDLGEVLSRFKKVLVPELNMGQLSLLVRAKYLIEVVSFSKVQGQPFKVAGLQEKILEQFR